MRTSAFPAIVGATLAILVGAMLFLVFGLSRLVPGIGTSVLGAPEAPPSIPQASVPSDFLTAQQSGASSGLTEGQIADAWSTVQAAADQGNWQAWAEVVDANTGEVLFSSDPSGLHTPASTQKVLTALFALDTLDPAQTLTTGVSQAGTELYLWGQGDLLLSAGAGNSSAINGRVGLADLAAQTVAALQQQAVTSVSLAYQETLFDGPLRNPAWAEQGVQDYAGDVGPFAIDTGRTAPGEWQFVSSSAAGVAVAFQEALSANGITVTSVQPGSAPSDATQIAAVRSAPVIDQIQFMLETSDNTMAEQYCHLATAASGSDVVDFVSSGAAVKSFLVESGIPAGDIVVADCSGLDSGSRLSADVLTHAITVSGAATNASGSLTRMFPVAGMTGTLDDRFEDSPLLGNVTAKTGSLGHVASLAGVLTTASGQNLVFAVGNDNVPDDGAYWTKEYLDQFVEFLASS